MELSATLSNCGKYRYQLRRVWDTTKPIVLFIGLNPSIADAYEDDNTSRVCINYAKKWGYGGLLMANLFAYRATYQSDLYLAAEPIGPENDLWLNKLKNEANLVVCVWGNSGAYKNRDSEVLRFIENPHCLVKLKSGKPGHPLYKSSDIKPIKL